MGGFNKSAPTEKKHSILEPVYSREKLSYQSQLQWDALAQ